MNQSALRKKIEVIIIMLDKNIPVYGVFRTARTSHRSMSDVNTCEDVTSTCQTCNVWVPPVWHVWNTHQPTRRRLDRGLSEKSSRRISLYIIKRTSRRYRVGPRVKRKQKKLCNFLTPTTYSSITRRTKIFLSAHS